MTDEGPDIAGNLAAIRARIAAAAAAVDRQADAVTLVAVSKGHPRERIERALDAGLRVFGENRVQEADAKYPALRETHPELELHLVGHLQSNKAEDAVRIFDVIQSVDRPRIARAIAKAAAKHGVCPPTVHVQVNTGEEPQKGGAAPGDTPALVATCRDLGLDVAGLMCIPPVDDESAPHFALLGELAGQCDVRALSMGMSDDFETAVKLGATYVRLGTAIFGPRPGSG